MTKLSHGIGLLTVAVVLVGAPRAATAPENRVAALEERRHELQRQLVKERVRLIAEDPDISAIDKQIRRLYRKLDRALIDKPVVKELNTELRAVEKALTDARGRG